MVIDSGTQDLDREFAAQTEVDARWAPVVESILDDILASSDMEFTDKEIECRTSMCRAVLTHPFDTPPPGFQNAFTELQRDLTNG